MYQNLLKKTTIYCFIFFVIAVSGMLYFDANKVIIIANAEEGTVKPDLEMEENFQTQYQLLMKNDSDTKNTIVIPLQNTILAEDVQVQNHYLDRELWIGICGGKADFYTNEYVVGDMQNVVYGGYDVVDDVLWIKISMKDTFEFENTMNSGKLTIKLKRPSEVYNKIVVLDAGHGGSDTGNSEGRTYEKEIVLDIVLLLQEKLKGSDIKVYYTRNDDNDVEMDKRVRFANSVDADMLISIHADYSDDTSKKGISSIYNSAYFIQNFDSIQLADILEKSVIKATGAKALGLLEVTDADVLTKEAKIPAAQINIGYLSNDEERKLLQEKSYQQELADGIYNAIMEVYKENLRK